MGKDMVEIGTSPFSHIHNPKKRAFLEAFAECGKVVASAEAAGISHTTLYTSQWKSDEEFQEAFLVAEEIAKQLLVDAARQRAIDGHRKYKFTKDGDAILHPELCECGHHVRAHVLNREDRTAHPCTMCDCSSFVGTPYYELDFSDTMLIFLMKGELPTKYGDRMRVEGAIKNIDLTRLPDHLIARIAAGEDIMAVLASAAGNVEEARAMLGSGLSGPEGGDDD